MSFKEFIKEKNDEDQEDKEMGAIIEYFSTHENPEDEEIHKMAKEFGYVEGDKGKTIHEFEDKIYALLSSILNAGASKQNPPQDVNEEDLKKGIEIEKKHTSSQAIARKLALDNLSLDKDYYKNQEK